VPPLPQRSGPVKVVKLDDLTSSELGTLSDSVLALLTRFTTLMDDPLLPELLRGLRDALVMSRPIVPGSRTSSRARLGRHDRLPASAG
jgi:hypothetical protein